MRINKFLGESGIVSRRGADKWIEDGRITINGEVATLGSKVEPGDDVRVDGKPVNIHACGHDAHSAMLLAAASVIKGKIKRGTL
mgnify:CR=1 FL=1